MTVGPDAPIVVVDAIVKGAALDVESIRAALGHPRSTGRDSEFLGRSSTEVWADDRTVVKVRPDLAVPFRDASPMADRVRWVESRIERERAIQAYPEDRTWFLVGDGDAVHVGVAAHRRRPLHRWTPEEFEAGWEWFAREFAALYLRAGEEGWRLDEGLSNFAPSRPAGPDGRPSPLGSAVADDHLIYLDDDLYAWDRGAGLRYGLVVLGRQAKWLTGEHGEFLGTAFRDQLEQHHQILNTRELAEDIRFDGRENAFLTALSAALAAPSRSRATSAAARSGEVRYVALISDVHANLGGLEAVLACEDVQRADRILFLGDSVGYGPDPGAVIDRLRSDPRVRAIKGNHDHAMVDTAATARFTKDARWSAEWTIGQLSESQRRWLADLPLELIEEDFVAVHGAPADPTKCNAYIYSMTVDDNLEKLELDGTQLCFYGNTHVPGAWVRQIKGMPGRFIPPDQPIVIDDYRNLLICPGSVGQPRDGRPGASYAIYDREARTVRWNLLDYDWKPVQERMRANGFPPQLLTRLDEGR